VKVVLASVILALAVYQLVLAAVSYGKLRPRFLEFGVGDLGAPSGRDAREERREDAGGR
jgi:hypothetical protein